MTKWIVVIFILLGLDQITKILIVSGLDLYESIPVIEDFFHITYTRNEGAVFGSMQGIAAQYYWLFIIFAIISIGIFGYLFFKTDFSDNRLFILRLALVLLIAGSLGNAIDRAVQYDHAVIDFIDFKGIWSYIFNFADVFLNVGIFFFFVDTFFLEKKRAVNNG